MIEIKTEKTGTTRKAVCVECLPSTCTELYISETQSERGEEVEHSLSFHMVDAKAARCEELQRELAITRSKLRATEREEGTE